MPLLKCPKAVMKIGRFTRKTLVTATSGPLVEIEVMIKIRDLTEIIGITVLTPMMIIIHQGVYIETTDSQ